MTEYIIHLSNVLTVIVFSSVLLRGNANKFVDNTIENNSIKFEKKRHEELICRYRKGKNDRDNRKMSPGWGNCRSYMVFD